MIRNSQWFGWRRPRRLDRQLMAHRAAAKRKINAMIDAGGYVSPRCGIAATSDVQQFATQAMRIAFCEAGEDSSS